MERTTFSEATRLLLLMMAALAGRAKAHRTSEKPWAAAAGVLRDTNERLTGAIASEGGSILTPRVDHDLVVKCMEARGYKVGSK